MLNGEALHSLWLPLTAQADGRRGGQQKERDGNEKVRVGRVGPLFTGSVYVCRCTAVQAKHRLE